MAEGRTRQDANRICDAAVRLAMDYGNFEKSGDARLIVLRQWGLMIGYHTPFNPLPRLTDEMRYLAAQEGRTAHLQPYGINIWQEDVGKVFSAGWGKGRTLQIDVHRAGGWHDVFEVMAALGECDHRTDRMARMASLRQQARPAAPAAKASPRRNQPKRRALQAS